MPKAPRPDEGFGKHIALEMAERGNGTSRCLISIAPIHLNPHGVVHGAVMYAMADQGMGAALYSKLEPDESCATIEIKIVYIAGVAGGEIECETRVINKGRRVAVLESEVRNGERLVAKALGTFAIFPLRV
jgi:acyl-CoA thioesterase